MNIEEKILLNEIRKKNRDVFELLFEQYYPILVKFSESYLHDLQACEDVVQSFFISLWTGSENININSSLKSYFYTSIKNLCLNRIRNLHVQDKHELLYIESLVNSDNKDVIFDSDIFDLINNAVEALPKQMAKIFRLKYFEGKQLKEIAKELNVTDGTVKTQLHRARTTLRDKLLISTNINFIL